MQHEGRLMVIRAERRGHGAKSLLGMMLRDSAYSSNHLNTIKDDFKMCKYLSEAVTIR